MSAEDPTTPLGFEYALMGQDPVVRDLKSLFMQRFRNLGKEGLEPRGILVGTYQPDIFKAVTHHRDERTGTHFYTVTVGADRELRFLITQKELEADRYRGF